MTSLMKTTLSLGTELLISAYLAKVDDFHDKFQQKVTRKLTRETVSALLFDFDMKNTLNKRLIALCVRKGVFADESQSSVVFTLMAYGKELMEFRDENLEPIEAGLENVEIEDVFRPNPKLVRY